MPNIAVRLARHEDLPAILEIYNDAVARTTAIWNETPTTLDERRGWFDARTAAGYPILVADEAGATLGYAAYGPFRPFDGFRQTAELSIYVQDLARGRGIGSLLLDALIGYAAQREVHVLVAGIEAGNAASLALHARAGFAETGRMPEVGRKFGRWLDLVLMQKIVTPQVGATGKTHAE